MANKALFQSTRGKMLPAATAINSEGALAYALELSRPWLSTRRLEL
jgi:hypothetical protein